jgi:hypothetical protein
MNKNSFFIVLILVLIISILFFFKSPTLISSKTSLKDFYQHVKIKDKYKIFIEHKGAFGEKEMAGRVKAAAENLGWEGIIIENIDEEKVLLNQEKFDFIISLSSADLPSNKIDNVKRYLFLSADEKFYFKKKWYNFKPKLMTRYKNIIYFDGFLYSFASSILLENYLKSHNKKFYGMTFYPYVQKHSVKFNITKFQNPKIFYCGFPWDKLRRSKRYKEFYEFLASAGYIDFYGPESAWKDTNHWRGEISFDKNSFLNTLANYPVTLILHSDSHLNGSIPSSRIFESSAVGNISISDGNQYVIQNFGDSVLYIDHTKSAKEMFQQVDNYMNWIKQNPNDAMNMAIKAHNVFSQKFLLESGLVKIAKMHEKILEDEG